MSSAAVAAPPSPAALDVLSGLLRDDVRQALQPDEEPRKPHVSFQVKMAWETEQRFHHAPELLQPIRDFVLDHTPFLQRSSGTRTRGRSTSGWRSSRTDR